LAATGEYRDGTWSSVLLHNVVRPEDVDDPTSDDAFCALPLLSAPLQHFSAACRGDPPRTQVEDLTNIYYLPIFNTTLEFPKMLALSPSKSTSFLSSFSSLH